MSYQDTQALKTNTFAIFLPTFLAVLFAVPVAAFMTFVMLSSQPTLAESTQTANTAPVVTMPANACLVPATATSSSVNPVVSGSWTSPYGPISLPFSTGAISQSSSVINTTTNNYDYSIRDSYNNSQSWVTTNTSSNTQSWTSTDSNDDIDSFNNDNSDQGNPVITTTTSTTTNTVNDNTNQGNNSSTNTSSNTQSWTNTDSFNSNNNNQNAPNTNTTNTTNTTNDSSNSGNNSSTTTIVDDNSNNQSIGDIGVLLPL